MPSARARGSSGTAVRGHIRRISQVALDVGQGRDRAAPMAARPGRGRTASSCLHLLSAFVCSTRGELAASDIEDQVGGGLDRGRRPGRTDRCRRPGSRAGNRPRRSGRRGPPSVGHQRHRACRGEVVRVEHDLGQHGRRPRGVARAAPARSRTGSRPAPPAARRCRRARGRRTRRAARRRGAPSGCRSRRRGPRREPGAAGQPRCDLDAERVVALEDVAHTGDQHARHQPPASVRGWAAAARPHPARSTGSVRARSSSSAPGSSSTSLPGAGVPSTSCSTAATVAV